MRSWRVTWGCLVVALVGAFLPWARIDLERAAEAEEGPGALALLMLSKMTKQAEATAWNGQVTVGTAKVPAWLVLVFVVLAAMATTLRARSPTVAPRGAALVLAVLGAALVVTFAIQSRDSSDLLAGFWVTAAGVLLVTASVARDPTPDSEA